MLHTFLQLWRRPSRVVGDYLRGRTVAYTNPLKYFLLALALLQLAAFWSGAVADFGSGLAEAFGLTTESQVVAAVDRLFVLLMGPSVLLLAALQKRAWRHARLHYGEHLVFALYVCAQQALIWIPFLVALRLLDSLHPYLLPLSALLAAGSYYLFSARRFFGGSLAGNTSRTAAVLIFTPLLYLGFAALALGTLGAIAGR